MNSVKQTKPTKPSKLIKPKAPKKSKKVEVITTEDEDVVEDAVVEDAVVDVVVDAVVEDAVVEDDVVEEAAAAATNVEEINEDDDDDDEVNEVNEVDEVNDDNEESDEIVEESKKVKKLKVSELKKIEFDLDKYNFDACDQDEVEDFINSIIEEIAKTTFKKEVDFIERSLDDLKNKRDINVLFEFHNAVLKKSEKKYKYLMDTFTIDLECEKCIIDISNNISKLFAQNLEIFDYLPMFKIKKECYNDINNIDIKELLNVKILRFSDVKYIAALKKYYKEDVSKFLTNIILLMMDYFSLHVLFTSMVKLISEDDDSFKLYCEKLHRSNYTNHFKQFENPALTGKINNKQEILKTIFPRNKLVKRIVKEKPKKETEKKVTVSTDNIKNVNKILNK